MRRFHALTKEGGCLFETAPFSDVVGEGALPDRCFSWRICCSSRSFVATPTAEVVLAEQFSHSIRRQSDRLVLNQDVDGHIILLCLVHKKLKFHAVYHTPPFLSLLTVYHHNKRPDGIIRQAPMWHVAKKDTRLLFCPGKIYFPDIRPRERRKLNHFSKKQKNKKLPPQYGDR